MILYYFWLSMNSTSSKRSKSTRWFSNRFPLLTFAQLFNHSSMKIHRNEDLLGLRFSQGFVFVENKKKVGNISPVTKNVAFQSHSTAQRKRRSVRRKFQSFGTFNFFWCWELVTETMRQWRRFEIFGSSRTIWR
jgi:hypothetical protein